MDLHTLAHLKRLLERLEGDPAFVREARADPFARQRLLDDASIALAASDLEPFWLHFRAAELSEADRTRLADEFAEHRLVAMWRDWQDDLATIRERETAVWVPWGDRRLVSWRARQLARVHGDVLARGLLPYPPLLAFELSRGCSVQCWFCALDPPRLEAWFPYTGEGRRLWRSLLEVSWELFGPACCGSTCYHATEPTDNPDYLRFLGDFHEMFGNYPQTTTARPLKNLAWTRAMLSLRKADPTGFDRFSVLSPHQLRRIHQAFSPEDLLRVLLVIQQRGLVNKALSGRILRRGAATQTDVRADPAEANALAPVVTQMTIECVCGYLLNLVERRVRLISPCNATPARPSGYQVHAEGTFEDAAGFKAFVERTIDHCMPEHLRPNDRLAFRPGLKYERHEDGFSLVGRLKRHDMRGDLRLGVLGDVLSAGTLTMGQLVDTLVSQGRADVTLPALSCVDRLYRDGLLQENTLLADGEDAVAPGRPA